MNVATLIDILKDIDPDRQVFVSSDEEGNSYRLAEVSVNDIMCDQDHEWVSCHPDDIATGEYAGWEDHMTDAIVFW